MPQKTDPVRTPTRPKYPRIRVQLSDADVTSFRVLGAVLRAMRTHKVPPAEISNFYDEATSGGHEHLRATCEQWVCLNQAKA
jgi:hypothetical protein